MALMSRSKVLGMPLEALFNASNDSVTAERMISCITSVADFVMSSLNAILVDSLHVEQHGETVVSLSEGLRFGAGGGR